MNWNYEFLNWKKKTETSIKFSALAEQGIDLSLSKNLSWHFLGRITPSNLAHSQVPDFHTACVFLFWSYKSSLIPVKHHSLQNPKLPQENRPDLEAAVEPHLYEREQNGRCMTRDALGRKSPCRRPKSRINHWWQPCKNQLRTGSWGVRAIYAESRKIERYTSVGRWTSWSFFGISEKRG